jgi:hypothetical protein
MRQVWSASFSATVILTTEALIQQKRHVNTRSRALLLVHFPLCLRSFGVSGKLGPRTRRLRRQPVLSPLAAVWFPDLSGGEGRINIQDDGCLPVTSRLIPCGATFAMQSCSRIMREQGYCKAHPAPAKGRHGHIEDRQGAGHRHRRGSGCRQSLAGERCRVIAG